MRFATCLIALTTLTSSACGDDAVATREVDSLAASETTDATGDTGETGNAGETTPDASPEVSPACPIAGTWNLQNVLCGENDITADWFRVIDRTTTVLATSGTGCALTTTNETDACTEEERGTLVAKSGDQWAVVSQGITACTPAACTFGGQDAACAIGDRATTYDTSIVLAAGRLSITSANGICAGTGGSTATTFIFEAR